MSTIVTCELQVQRGHVDEILHRATQQLAVPSHRVTGRRQARLYQHLDDPHRLLYVGDWDSPEAFEAYRSRLPMPGRADQFVSLPVCHIYRRLALFEHVLAPFDVACVDLVQGPAESHAARRDLALAYHRAEARRQPGLVLLMTNERIEHPQDLTLISYWQAPALASQPTVQALRLPDESLQERLRAQGGVVHRFMGRQVLATNGAA